MEKDFQCYLGRHSSGSHYIPVPEDIALSFLEAGHKRVLCHINESFALHCAIMRTDQLGYFITISKRVRKEAKIQAGDELNIVLAIDKSTYQAKMPEELVAALEIEEEAAAIFHSLSPGRQRTILHLVSSAKRTDTRIRRALKIMENLKMGARNPNEFLR